MAPPGDNADKPLPPRPSTRTFADDEVVTPCADGVERVFRFQGEVRVDWDTMPRTQELCHEWTVQPHTCRECRAVHEEGRDGSNEHIEAERGETPCNGYCGFHPHVAHILRRKRTEQHTPEWYAYRKNMLTASNLAPIVGVKGFVTKQQLFSRKTGDWDPNVPHVDSPAMAHGRKYEEEAGRVFEQVCGIQLFKKDIGLLEHPDYPWIGASPDFVGMYDPVLVETKVPYSRTIEHSCPDKYWTQIQQQLAVCDLETAYLVQYMPPNACTDGILDVVRVDRDREWWNSVAMPALRSFRAEVVKFYRDAGRPFGSRAQGLPRAKLEGGSKEVPNRTTTGTQTAETGQVQFIRGTTIKIVRKPQPPPQTPKQRFPAPGKSLAIVDNTSLIYTGS